MIIQPFGTIFHYFKDGKIHKDCQGALTEKEFAKIINYLRSNYVLLDADEFLFQAKQGTPGITCITIDDGVRSQYDIARSVLNREKIKAFWFIYTSHFNDNPSRLEIYHDFRFTCYNSVDDFYCDFYRVCNESKFGMEIDIDDFSKIDVSNYRLNSDCHTVNDLRFRFIRDVILNKNQFNDIMMSLIKYKNYSISDRLNKLWISAEELKVLENEGHVIGLHSETHPTKMINNEYAVQLNEYSTNKSTLERLLGGPINCVAYPSGSYNLDTLLVMKKLNIEYAFTANRMRSLISMLELPRRNHTEIVDEMKQK